MDTKALVEGLNKINWLDGDGDLIRWARAGRTLGAELVAVFGEQIDVQEGGMRRLNKFYQSRAHVDAVFPSWGVGMEVDRRLHNNSDNTKLRKFLNECVKLLADPRHPDFEDYDTVVLHYFTATDRQRYRQVFKDCPLPEVAELFAPSPKAARLNLQEIVRIADRYIAVGNSKDVKYWGEIRGRVLALVGKGYKTMTLAPTELPNKQVQLLLLGVIAS